MEALRPIKISTFTLATIHKAAKAFRCSNPVPPCGTETSGKQKAAVLTIFMVYFPPKAAATAKGDRAIHIGIKFLVWSVGCVVGEGERL